MKTLILGRTFAGLIAALLALPLFAASDAISFTDGKVIARVTRGAQAVWLTAARNGGFVDRRAHIVTDADYDGVVEWPQPRPVAETSVWGVLDLTSRQFHVASGPSVLQLQRTAFEYEVLRDTDGRYTWFNWPGYADSRYTIVWIRPGVGAWRVHPSFLVQPILPQRVGDSPRSPGGFRYGDYLVGLHVDDRIGGFFSGLVDDRLNAAKTGPAIISALSSSYTEGFGSGPHVMRRGSTEGVSKIDFAITDGTAVAGTHFTGESGTITFLPGEVYKALPVSVINDDIYSGKTSFVVNWGNVVGATLVGETSSRLVIHDDESPPVVHVTGTTVTEGSGGTREIPVTVTLTGKTRLPASANWFWSTDAGEGKGQLIFSPAQHQYTVLVPYLADTVAEPDERLNFGIGSTVNATVGDAHSIWINDDDSVGIRPSNVAVSEKAAVALVPVTLTRAHVEPVSVTYRLERNEDLSVVSGVLTFAPGETERSVAVPIIADPHNEPDEIFPLFFSGASANATVQRASAIITLIDDDEQPVLSLPETLTIEEGATTWFPLETSRGFTDWVAIRVRTKAHTAVGGRDYVGELNARFDFALPDREGYEFLWFPAMIDDEVREGDETFEFTISAAEGATIRNGSMLVTILDDDQHSLPGISAEAIEVREGVTAVAQIELRLSAPSETDVLVTASTESAAAVSGLDFSAVRRTVRIPAGRTTAVVEVPIIDDGLFEEREDFTIVLSESANALVETPAVKVTILDRDRPDIPDVNIENIVVREDAETAVVTVVLSSPAVSPLHLNYSTVGDTAVEGEDYVGTIDQIQFMAGEMSKTIKVPLVNDKNKEGDEAFVLRVGEARVVCTILDDEATPGRGRSVRH